MDDYEESILLKKLSPVTKPQLANFKGAFIQTNPGKLTAYKNAGKHRPSIKRIA